MNSGIAHGTTVIFKIPKVFLLLMNSLWAVAIELYIPDQLLNMFLISDLFSKRRSILRAKIKNFPSFQMVYNKVLYYLDVLYTLSTPI